MNILEKIIQHKKEEVKEKFWCAVDKFIMKNLS